MEFAQVIQYVIWGSWVFISLWMLATLFKEGLWGNYLTYVCWLLAFMVMLNLGYGLAGFAVRQLGSNGEDPFIASLVGIGICGLCLVVPMAIFRTATDKLSRVQVYFPPILNNIGAVLLMLSLMSFGTLTYLSKVKFLIDNDVVPWWLQPGRLY